MPGLSGLKMAPRILEHSPDTVVIMISGEQTIDYAIEAMRAGAFDYITKPFDLRQVGASVQRALKHQRLLEEKRRYENHLEEMVMERIVEIEHLAYHDHLTDLARSEEHTSELQSQSNLVCRLLLEKKKKCLDHVEHT